jgi:membrane-bound ClpP family serine protease
MKNARLIIALITNLIYELIIVAVIIFGLPRLGIHIPVYGTVLICAGFLIFAVIFYRIGSTILRKQPLPGLSDMIGMEGRVVSRLNPDGLIRISSELWKARSESGEMEYGEDVIVTGQTGLRLIVRRK